MAFCNLLRYVFNFQIWRAVRLIVDTGLHYTGMKRDEAIKLFAEKAWDDSDFTRKEVRKLFSDKKSIMDKLRCHCLFNKLTSVFHASVLLLIMNFVITLSK